MGQPRPLFCLFLSYRTENLSSQQDSNSDRWSRRQDCGPLDHHHGPNKLYYLKSQHKAFNIYGNISKLREDHPP